MQTSRKINLGGVEFLVVDLTEPLRSDIEVYPGEPKPTKEVISDIREHGFQYNVFRLGEHNFHPHGDAPRR
jgi:kynurenine formamidase